jgi:hypothetical protein
LTLLVASFEIIMQPKQDAEKEKQSAAQRSG